MRIDGYRPPQMQPMKPAQAQLQGSKGGALDALRPGETFTATVSESGPKGLILTLPDGTQVTASRNTPLDVSPGDKIEMTVTGKSGSQVLVEMNLPKNTDPTVLLRAFGAEASKENVEIIREFLKNGVAPTRENFNTIRSMLSEFNTLSPDKAAFMIKNDIPINAQNITMFQNFLNNEAQLGGKLMELHGLLESLGSAEKAPDAGGMAAALSAEPDAGNMPAAQAQAQTAEKQAAAPQDARAGNMQQAVTQSGENIPASAQSGRVPADSLPVQAGEQTQTNAAAPVRQDALQSQNAAASSESLATQKPQAQPASVPAGTEQEARAAQDNAARTSDAPVKAPGELRDASAANAARTETLQRPADTAETAVKTTQQSMPERAADTGAAAPREAAMTELRDMVKNLFRQIDDTNSRAFARQMEAPRVVKELATVLGLISERIGEMNEAQRSQASAIVRDIAQNLKFMEHLNNYTAFAQIPLMLNGNPTTANMYVWGDGNGKRKIDPENSTIFLSLSTANIGRVESYVRIIGKNVECDFKLESMETLNIIQGNIVKLGNMLQGEGYRLSRVSFYESDKASNVLDIMETRGKETRRFNFDMTV